MSRAMRRRGLLPIIVLATLVTGAMLPGTVRTARAAAQTLVIGVDNAPPSGHNWEFLDFFPRSGISVHNGDTLDFKLNTASADGFHTVVFGKPGDTAAQIAASLPNVGADSGGGDGDAAGQQAFVAFFGTQPPAGSGGPGACGDNTTPCTYDGTKDLASGPMPVFGTDFFLKVQLGSSPSQSVSVNYICNVHGPVMSGSFTIVPDAATASTQSELDSAATAQYNADIAAGQSAQSSAGAAAVTTNADGTHTITMTAGTESSDGHVQILEMLPGSVNVTVGDHVRWSAPSKNDPHTVTFPRSPGSDSVDPFPTVCEAGTSADAPATAGPPTFGCQGPPGSPTGLEVHYVPQPQGATTLTSPSTVGSSGVLDSGSYWPTTQFPQYTFSFANPGTYLYQCRIHDHMLGQIVVSAKATTPIAPPPSGAGARLTPPFVLLPIALLLAGCGVLAFAWRRRVIR